MSSDPSDDVPKEQHRFRADYIKGSHFRVIHGDGVFGGVTPRGYIQLDIWSERQPIPQQATYRLVERPDGGLQPEEIREQRLERGSVIREVEVGIVIDLSLAKSMIEWLQKNVDVLEMLSRGGDAQPKPGSDE